jgi:hypothetical protein
VHVWCNQPTKIKLCVGASCMCAGCQWGGRQTLSSRALWCRRSRERWAAAAALRTLLRSLLRACQHCFCCLCCLQQLSAQGLM